MAEKTERYNIRISGLGGQGVVTTAHILGAAMDNAGKFASLVPFFGSEKRKGYQSHLNIICVMDSGDGAAFVYRKDEKSMMIPMPVFGHWMKKGWGFYFKHSKLGNIPRIPGM